MCEQHDTIRVQSTQHGANVGKQGYGRTEQGSGAPECTEESPNLVALPTTHTDHAISKHHEIVLSQREEGSRSLPDYGFGAGERWGKGSTMSSLGSQPKAADLMR